MDQQAENDKGVPLWKASLKKGAIYLVVAGLIVLAIYGLHEARIVRGGAIGGILALGFIVLCIVGIVNLIKGLIGKTRANKSDM